MFRKIKNWLRKQNCQADVVAFFKHRIQPLSQQQRQAQRYLRVYASVPCENASVCLNNPSAIFAFFSEHLHRMAHRPNKIPIFLHAHTAMRYSQFHHPHHVVVTLIVPEVAVAGQANYLLIKPAHISLNHIQGCTLGWQKQSPYLENPLFDNDLKNHSHAQKNIA